MARLLTVIGERQMLLNAFRSTLEDQYIEQARTSEFTHKKAVADSILQERDKAKAEELKKPMKLAATQVEDLAEVFKGASSVGGKDTAISPADYVLIRSAGEKLTQSDLLKKYVKDKARLLQPRQRCMTLAVINAMRAKQAKVILTKELYAISKFRKEAEKEKEKEKKPKDAQTAMKERLAKIQ